MKKQTKKIIIWAAIAIVAILLLIIFKNLDAFVKGFNTGGTIGE